MKMEIIYCSKCNKVNFINDKFTICNCPSEFISEGIFTITRSNSIGLKKTKFSNIMGFLIYVDISFWLSFIGLLMVNIILVNHFNLSFIERLLEGFGVGLMGANLLKNK
jgi:hypothetical protein